MINKQLLIISSICLGVGFATGRFLTPTIKSEIKRSETQGESKKEAIIQSHGRVAHHAATDTETIVKKIFYCPSGKVKSEMTIEKKFGATQGEHAMTAAVSAASQSTSSITTASMRTEYAPRWGVGVFLSPAYPLKPFEPSEFTGQLSYRVIGPFSVAFQSDIMFKHPQLGVIFNF